LNTLSELKKELPEEMLEFIVDPIDSVMNDAPSFQGNNIECVNSFVLQNSYFFRLRFAFALFVLFIDGGSGSKSS